MSDGLRWAPIGWPPHLAPCPTFPAERTLLLRFLHSYLHCLQIDAGWAPRGQIGELIFAPRVSRECTSGCIEVRKRGTDCCAPYLGGSFCGMHPQHVSVCACYCMGWALQRVRGNWNGNSIVRDPRPTSWAAFPARTRIFSTRHVSFSIRLLLP